MIRLGELVGAVLNEMAVARTKASLFSAQMAADFRDHEILSQLPVPTYRIDAAELSIPFVVVKASPGEPKKPPLIDPSRLKDVAREVVAALPGEEAVKEAFTLHDDQPERWRREAAPAIAERFAADAGEARSPDTMAALLGHLVKSHFLLSLIGERQRLSVGRLRQHVQAGHPESVEKTAIRLFEAALGGRPRPREEGADDETGLGGAAPEPDGFSTGAAGDGGRPDTSILVEVEAEALAKLGPVSTLKLELDEDTLERLTFADDKEGGHD